MGRLLVFGTSHRVAPSRLRDGLYMDEEAVTGFLDGLTNLAVIDEAVLLHTCTRLEVYVRTSDIEAAENEIVRRLAGDDDTRLEEVANHSYALADAAVAQHLLRVAAGLDSIVLGETQILGQVRDAARIAARHGATGPILTRLFATAVRAGKRARAETRLCQGPTSLAAAGVRLALQASDDFPSQTVLVVGAGETARLTARHVAKRRPRRLVIANRSRPGAERLAAELGGDAASLTDLGALAREATVVVAATSAAEPVLTEAHLEEAMADRGDRPLVVIDLGRPRNVAVPYREIPGLAIHDLDGLAESIGRNRDRQSAEVPRVEAIIDEEVERFTAWHRSREVLPHLRALRRHFFEAGRREFENHEARFGLDQREALEAYTRTLLSKLLHEPTVRIKQTDRETAEGLATLDAVAALFDLDV
ncbi:MAG: glutamyl-tRNA reductase [Gemmatimonadota bacterium]